jgi:hypothetical protein
MVRCRVATLSAVIVFCASIASAQTSTVSGRVANVQGGVVPNAEATLRPLPAAGAMPNMPNMPNMPAAGAERTAAAGADGVFSFTGVAPGEYVLQVDESGFERSSQPITVANQPLTFNITLTPLEIPGAEGIASAGVADTQILLDRIKQLEQRISDLEANTVLSEPETRVKRIEVYVDQNNNVHDEPVPGAQKQVTYQRERVYRRQWLTEKLEQAFADQDAKKIAVGVSAASVTQFAHRTRGTGGEANGHAYQLNSADLLFAAGLAQYTSFFADVVGLSGSPPDAEIHSLTLLNSYTARLVRQNELNVREAWLRTELFSQRLALNAGRLDLTNYFDRNAVANDETAQFVSDGLVNNPMLGLAVNGAGVAGVFDPKNGFAFKAGFQQSNTDATNLSSSLYSLAEVDYLARPKGLGEGNYRAWFRNDNTSARNRQAGGLSIDQKLTPILGLFARYGTQETAAGNDHFYSGGFQFAKGWIFNPQDYWGVGYAETKLGTGDRERLAEGYYNFLISEKLRLSFHLQHVFEQPAGQPHFGFLLPAIRVQARF